MAYFTVLIPWEPDATKRTSWHPTTPTGPFQTLTRGAFQTQRAAHEWAREKLGAGATYSLRLDDIPVPPPEYTPGAEIRVQGFLYRVVSTAYDHQGNGTDKDPQPRWTSEVEWTGKESDPGETFHKMTTGNRCTDTLSVRCQCGEVASVVE